jgi:hypothetical protein
VRSSLNFTAHRLALVLFLHRVNRMLADRNDAAPRAQFGPLNNSWRAAYEGERCTMLQHTERLVNTCGLLRYYINTSARLLLHKASSVGFGSVLFFMCYLTALSVDILYGVQW